MAITKLLRMKEITGKNKASHLKHNIFYICDPEKTEGGLYIGGNAGATPDAIYHTMIRNKRLWNKEKGSQGFHYMLSFPPDCGVDENMSLQIAEEFCDELLKKRFYYVCAVHNDKQHMHVHITFDSVSKEDGYKFHSPKGDWEKRIQPITDKLCEKYHLPTLCYNAERKGVSYREWINQKTEAGSERNYTWDDIIRDDIDEAIDHSENMEEFIQYMKAQKYVVRDGKYLSLRPYGKPQGRRTSRLGRGYGKTEIASRIADKALTPQIRRTYKMYGDWSAMQTVILAKIKTVPGWEMSPFLRQFYRRWNFTVFIRKPGLQQPWKYKKEILEVGKLSESISYMIDHDIRSIQDVQGRKNELVKTREAVERKLQAVCTKLYRSKTAGDDKRADMQKEIAEYRASIKRLKKEISLAEYIIWKFYEMDQVVGEGSFRVREMIELDGREYTRITINRKMFHDMNPNHYVSRIPYMKNTYVKIPAKDCEMHGEGEMFEAYLFHEQKYELQNSSGLKTGSMFGSELKTHYEDKTGRRRTSKNQIRQK